MKRICLATLLLSCAPLLAGSPAEDWAALTALDAGPQKRPASSTEARSIAVEHLAKQERLLRVFLHEHPGDSRAVEAKLRLARALQLKADVQDARIASPEIDRLIAEAEKQASPEQRADVRFSSITYTMRRMRNPDAHQRQQLYDLAKNFQATYPEDRRLGGLLAEIATRFDHEPRRKRELLITARAAARDEEVKARIADDFKRLDLLGEKVPLRFQAPGGAPLDLAQHRGKVVVLIFFAAWSQPAVEAIDQIQASLSKVPTDHLQIFGVSLDTKQAPLENLARQRKITWPVVCDGRGWESPLVRSLGINALPTVWLLDREGRLASLDGLDGFISQVRELVAKR